MIQFCCVSLPACLKGLIQMMIVELRIGEKKQFVCILSGSQTDGSSQERFRGGIVLLQKTQTAEVDVGGGQTIIQRNRLLQRIAGSRVVSQVGIDRTEIV